MDQDQARTGAGLLHGLLDLAPAEVAVGQGQDHGRDREAHYEPEALEVVGAEVLPGHVSRPEEEDHVGLSAIEVLVEGVPAVELARGTLDAQLAEIKRKTEAVRAEEELLDQEAELLEQKRATFYELRNREASGEIQNS